MDLKDKKCIPCEGYVPPLSLEQKHAFLKTLSTDWHLTHDSTRLRREFKFKNFKRSWDFVNVVSNLAEKEKHHPELSFGWGHLEIEIWTHTQKNVVENDFILAAKIDEAFLNSSTAST